MTTPLLEAKDSPVSPSTDRGCGLTLREMFLLHDALVPRTDAWWLVDRLRVVGRADETIAASVLERALTDRALGVTLTEAECDAVLDALCRDTPRAGLVELRGALLREREL